MSADRRTCAVLLASLLLPLSAGAATIVVNNVDMAGLGFNDPTAFTPLPDNPATTLGDARLNVFNRAAQILGDEIDSDVLIIIQSTFNPGSFGQPQACTANSAVLGSAGAIQVFRDFPGAPVAGTWYHVALANALSGVDQSPGAPDGTFGGNNDDVRARFNNLLDDDPNCLGGSGWYYGLDHNEGAQTDLLAVVLHEISHGLGFSNFDNVTNGAQLGGFPGIYSRFILDLSTGLTWDQMNNTQRVASAINDPNVVWNGPVVTALQADFLSPPAVLVVNSPGSIAGTYPGMAASFGPLIPSGGLTGNVVLATDGVAAPDVNDGCEALTNGGAIAGNIALIHRGTCNFTVKVAFAQAVGATGVIISNNASPGLPPMGGSDPSITIPSIGVEMSTGTAIEAELGGGVNATIGVDPGQPLAGTNAGRVRLNAPNPVAPGSSISHWTPDTYPNLLMEPAINSSLTDELDLTLPLFSDIGWTVINIFTDGFESGDTAGWSSASP